MQELATDWHLKPLDYNNTGIPSRTWIGVNDVMSMTEGIIQTVTVCFKPHVAIR